LSNNKTYVNFKIPLQLSGGIDMSKDISKELLGILIFPDGRMSTKDASKYTGFSEKTLAMMRCNGTGPKFLKRGRIFYFKEDLDDWLNAPGRSISTAQAQHLMRTTK
jgi:hypothetical protein